jgi:sodium-independent sulfate anion transporter 11
MPTSIIFATALIIGFDQVGALVSLKGTPTIVFSIIVDFLKRLLDWDGLTCGSSVGTIVILLGFKKVCKQWGEWGEHFVIKYIASSRAVVVLVSSLLLDTSLTRIGEMICAGTSARLTRRALNHLKP